MEMKKANARLIAVLVYGATLGLALCGRQASAQNLVANPSFEAPVLSFGEARVVGTGDSIGAWQVIGPQVAIIETNYSELGNGMTQFNAQEGLNALDMTGTGNVGPTAGVQQTITTVAGQAYTLSFYVGRADGNVFFAGPATISLSIDGGALTSYTNSGTTPGFVNWQQFSMGFTATSTGTEIAFFNATPFATNYAGLDNVSVTAVVTAPEPATFSLLTLGGMGIVLCVRRRLANS